MLWCGSTEVTSHPLPILEESVAIMPLSPSALPITPDLFKGMLR